MAIATKLKNYLDENKVHYHILAHHERFTAPEIAQALHVPGRMLAKVVLIKADDREFIVTLDANTQIDLTALGQAIGATYVTLATEEEIRQRFPDCEVGAMPPFGNLYDLPVVVDAPLSMDKEIVFEAGNHHEAIQMNYSEYANLVHPHIAEFGIK